MKLTRILTMAVSAAALSVFSISADAQMRGHGGGNRHGGGHGHGGHGHGGHGHGGNGVNFFFGGFGYPYFGYWGSPFYYGYPYGYGYGYPVGAYYSYDPRGIYQGRVVNPGQPTNGGGGKDFSMAARVQQELATAGYYRGSIDGVVGDGTRRAIRNYKRDNGLPVDGQIDRQLLATMGFG